MDAHIIILVDTGQLVLWHFVLFCTFVIENTFKIYIQLDTKNKEDGMRQKEAEKKRTVIPCVAHIHATHMPRPEYALDIVQASYIIKNHVLIILSV